MLVLCVHSCTSKVTVSVNTVCAFLLAWVRKYTHKPRTGYMWFAGYESLISTVCLCRVYWAEALKREACWMVVCNSGICMCVGSVYSTGPIEWSVLCCGMCRTTISISSEVIWCCLPFVCRRRHNDWWVMFVYKKLIASWGDSYWDCIESELHHVSGMKLTFWCT